MYSRTQLATKPVLQLISLLTFISVNLTFASSSGNWLGLNNICDAVTFFPQLFFIDDIVSHMAFCCVSRLDRRMVLAAGCVGAKAEQLPTMRRADRMARRKRFILAFIEWALRVISCKNEGGEFSRHWSWNLVSRRKIHKSHVGSSMVRV